MTNPLNAHRRLVDHDIPQSLTRLPMVGLLAWHDIKSRYRRSAIGPFWITLSMGVMIASIGLVFGQLFQTPMDSYLPFLAVGLISWTFVTGALNEGCNSLIEAESIVKQLPVPLFVYVLRVLCRNAIMFAHHLIIVPFVFLAVGKSLSWTVLLVLPCLLLVAVCLSWMGLLLGLLCARYRDLPQIVASVLQVAFYLTPIIWMPSLLPERAGVNFLDLNPFYHGIELIRGPLLGEFPSVTSVLVICAASLAGWLLTFGVYARLARRVPYWL